MNYLPPTCAAEEGGKTNYNASETLPSLEKQQYSSVLFVNPTNQLFVFFGENL